MNYASNKVSDVQIAYIGGGSRGWAWTFIYGPVHQRNHPSL